MLTLPSRRAPGVAVPLLERLHPELPEGVTWLLEADAAGAECHRDRAVELELDLRWTRVGCTRVFELVLHTRGKTSEGVRPRLGTFRHTFHPVDRTALPPLLRLARQPWWWLVVRGPEDVVAQVELANTLDLRGLLRRTLAEALPPPDGEAC